MNYKDIFKPETLAKLDKQSADNLRKMMGNKSLMDKLVRSQELLSEINEAEKPYRDLLEALAIDMVKQMYPIIDEENINIDAKIIDISQVGQELDEIKINNPNIKKIMDDFATEWDESCKDTDDIEYAQDQVIEKYVKKYPNISIAEFIEDYIIKCNNINESITPESRRRIINGITQGAALRGSFAFYMFKEYLDQIDETLVDKYKEIMEDTFGIYDDENVIAMALAALAQGRKSAGGSSKVIVNEIKINNPLKFTINDIWDLTHKLSGYWDFSKNEYSSMPNYNWTPEESNKRLHIISNIWKKYGYKAGPYKGFLTKLPPAIKIKIFKDLTLEVNKLLSNNQNLQESSNPGITIRARAICFPMLVHEIIKGLYELVSLQGFKGDKEQNQAVVDKVDQLKNEPHDIKYGKYIYDALNKIFSESEYNEPRIREFFFTEVYQLDDEDFLPFIENAINNELTSKQKQWVKITLKEISDDIKADDTGLDEIKINNPNPYNEYIINFKFNPPKSGDSLLGWLKDNEFNIEFIDKTGKNTGNYSLKFTNNEISQKLRYINYSRTLLDMSYDESKKAINMIGKLNAKILQQHLDKYWKGKAKASDNIMPRIITVGKPKDLIYNP